MHHPSYLKAILMALSVAGAATLNAASSSNWKFDFGSGSVQTGYTQVLPSTAYNSTTGYGFASTSGLTSVSRGAPDALRGDYITSSSAFKFSANVPNGNYNVTVTTGDNTASSDTSIKSEVERIVAQNIRTTAGQFSQYSFTVNIKDGVLDLTFSGPAAKVNGIDIQATSTAITMFLAGDSTVCDQTTLPYAGWGQEFTSYLNAGVAVANYADSGETSASFWNGFYVPGIQPRIKANDYLFIQFGHNDEKSLTTDQYKSWLQKYVDDAKAHGAKPVLVTPLERIVFSGSTLTWSHGAFPDAMKQVASANGVPCIDLTTKSHNLWQSIGSSAVTAYFVSGDKTHTNSSGALLAAGLVRDGIRELNLSPLASYLISSSGGTGGPIANGTYSLRNVASGKCLDNLGATTDGAEVGQWTDGSSNNQKWVVSLVSGSTYKLSCVTGGKYLDSLGHTTDGSTVGQYASSSSNNQLWTISASGSGYKLTNVASGKCLDTAGSTTDGAIMKLWGSSSSNNQVWQFVTP